jgi:hypothetical protein
VALDAILAKLDSSCKHIALIPLDDPRVDAALAAHPREEMAAAYENVLLAELSSATRGEVLAALVRGIDDERSSGAVTDADDGQCSDGTRRSANQLAYDWKRGDTRIECKGAQLVWNKSVRCWVFQFSSIKFDQGVFDELLLALFTPRGVYVNRHDGKLGRSTRGKISSTTGHVVQLCGPGGGDLDQKRSPRLGVTWIKRVRVHRARPARRCARCCGARPAPARGDGRCVPRRAPRGSERARARQSDRDTRLCLGRRSMLLNNA